MHNKRTAIFQLPVQGENEEVEDRGCGGRVVDRQEHLADSPAKVPFWTDEEELDSLDNWRLYNQIQ